MKRLTEEEMDLENGSVEVLNGPDIDPDTPYMSEESELPAEPSLHARSGPKGGRPRKDGIKPGLVDPDQAVPNPTYRVFKSDATNPHQSSRSGWNYWNSLPDWAKGKIVAYVYRDHPILLDPGFDENDTYESRQYKYIDKISGTEPIQDDMDLLHRYGCGTYRVVLKDASSKRKIDKPVYTVWIMNIGGSDYKSNPPTDARINDVDQIDLDSPANKSYVSFLRGQGKLPEQLNSKQQENEVANIQLIDKLTDNLLASSKEKNKDTGVLQDAMKGAMDVMQKGAEAAIQTTREANEYAAKLRDDADARRATLPSTTAVPATDPVTAALQIIEAIKRVSGDGNGASAEVMELRSQLNQFLTNQIASQQKQIEMLMDAKVTTPAAAASSPFSSMKEGLESLREMKSVVDDFAGKAEADAAGEGVESAIGAAAPAWVTKYLIPLSPLIGQVAAAFLQSRGQSPMPMQMPPPQGMPYPPPGYPQQQMPQQQIQPPPPVSIDNPNNLPPPAIEILSTIKDSLAFHMDYGMSGTEFAGWYARQFGEPKYREIAGIGVTDIMQLLSLYPPTQRTVSLQKPEYVQEFVADFVSPKMDENDGEDDVVPPSTIT